jgi:hypothetical protein
VSNPLEISFLDGFSVDKLLREMGLYLDEKSQRSSSAEVQG